MCNRFVTPSAFKKPRKTFCLKLSTLLKTHKRDQFWLEFPQPIPCFLTMFDLRFFFFFPSLYTSGQLLHFTRQLPYTENNVKDKITVKQKKKHFKMNKESICAQFSLCLNSEYLGVSSYTPKRCLRQLVLLKGKLGQLPFAVIREWSLNIVYGLYYGLFGLQHQQN